jgi:hypothetical protein
MKSWRDPRPEIARFWSWWPSARQRIEDVHARLNWNGNVVAEVLSAIQPELAEAVSSIHPELNWEFKLANDERMLVVTANGDPELRSSAERWLRSAPVPDAGWRFSCYRPADPGAFEGQLQLESARIDMQQTRFAYECDDEAARVHVTVCHPEFSALNEDSQLQAVFVALDRALGEDEVIRWVGAVETADTSPEDAVSAAGFRSAVCDFADAHRIPERILMQDTVVGGLPRFTATTVPMRAIDFPLYDQHIAVTLRYDPDGPTRLPDRMVLMRLQQFETDLEARLAGRAVLAGHQTWDGHRVVHVYADPATDTAGQLSASPPAWQDGPSSLDVSFDPGWDAVSHFLF